MDMLTYDCTRIHPLYIHGERPPSRQSKIFWPEFPYPPRNYWKLWSHFLHVHISQYCNSVTLHWNTTISSRYKVIFYKHRHSPHLFRILDNDIACFSMINHPCKRPRVIHQNAPYTMDIHYVPLDFFPIVTHYIKDGIITCGLNKSDTHGLTHPARYNFPVTMV
jgi:hypothetical protein